MKKRGIIILISMVSFVALMAIISNVFFSLRYVTVDFLSTTDVLDNKEQTIINSADFDYGESIFFIEREEYIDKLELNNPYLEVISLEVIFPNRVIIHAIERNEFFAFALSDSTYAICDNELKVLKIVSTFENSTENAMLVDNSALTIDVTNAVLGTTLNIPESYANIIKNFATSAEEWDSNLANLRGNVTGIELNYERDNQLLISMRQGVQIIVKDSNENLSDKLQLAFSVYDSNPTYREGGIIQIIEELTGEIVASYYNE
ncbi:MAG: cell division protein FtsQ/DivIB [Spirochaetales bacterium]